MGEEFDERAEEAEGNRHKRICRERGHSKYAEEEGYSRVAA